eukprot:1960797-Prymnesium_polylepis.2
MSCSLWHAPRSCSLSAGLLHDARRHERGVVHGHGRVLTSSVEFAPRGRSSRGGFPARIHSANPL